MNISLQSNVQRQILPPRIVKCSPRIKIILVTVALSSVWVPGAVAACGSSVQQLPPSVSSALQLPQPLQEAASDGVAAENPQRGGDPSMTGLWKTVFVAGGAVVNLGFNTWHNDGTEWALDGTFPPVGGNVCPGVWEKIGRRSYLTVHPAFDYDASNTHVVGIFIERLKITISPDGNSYQGDFTWDNYDLQGNLLSDLSVAGRIMGTRIQVGSAFPFPFPQSQLPF
jgi:hypothetical protein